MCVPWTTASLQVLSVIRMRDELRRISQRGRQQGQGGGILGVFRRMGSRAETIIAHNTDTWCVELPTYVEDIGTLHFTSLIELKDPLFECHCRVVEAKCVACVLCWLKMGACRYWLALLIALAINLTLFADATVDVSSSYGCGLGEPCRRNPFFHWVTQSWSPYVMYTAHAPRYTTCPSTALQTMTPFGANPRHAGRLVGNRATSFNARFVSFSALV